jgi:uncharacterized membrane protein
MADTLLRPLLVVLSLVGLADALYFTLAYYGRVRKARWVPEVLCAREGSSCVTVLQSSYARFFGAPNSLLGVIYYGVLIVWDLGYPWPRFAFVGWSELLVYLSFSNLLVLASVVTVGLGFYLVYALRRKLHVDCPLCYAAHAINAALLVLLIMLH